MNLEELLKLLTDLEKSTLERTFWRILDYLLEWVPQILMAIAIAVVAFLVARMLRRFVRRQMARTAASPAIIALLSNLLYSAILLGGLFFILGLFGLDKTVTSLLAGAGIVGLALGFALKDLAAGYISGVLLAIIRPFEINDVIEVSGHMGVVTGIGMWKTVIENFDGQSIMIPNNQVFSGALVNYSRNGKRRIEVRVGVAYDTDLRRAERVAREALEQIESRLTDEPVEVFFTNFGASSIDCVTRVWIPYPEGGLYFAVQHEVVVRIKAAFDAADITIPFPIRTIVMDDNSRDSAGSQS
ncbi:MAG: mechanosensitive ion channel [Leptospiraceae bacterium]|nr:mechanosensitive ion channel [Leptospiraceae bacterium]